MQLEVLVSTMNQKSLSLIEKMNIKTNALIINQSEQDNIVTYETSCGNYRMLTFNEKGLSKSRNRAIDNSLSDICLIADDDVVYNDDYEEIIKKSYEKYKDYDVIVFQVPTTNTEREKKYSTKIKKLNLIDTFKVYSYEITFKRESITNHNIRFNEDFGAGSGKYLMGEENIFLKECLDNGLNILYLPISLGHVTHETSTWLSKRDRQFFISKGAFFREISFLHSIPLILQFALRKYKLYKDDTNFFDALKYMFLGRKIRSHEMDY